MKKLTFKIIFIFICLHWYIICSIKPTKKNNTPTVVTHQARLTNIYRDILIPLITNTTESHFKVFET